VPYGTAVFVGLSVPGAVTREGIARIAPDAIVFAMTNPTPEVAAGESQARAADGGTGHAGQPDRSNNGPAFPGEFRGALDVRASTITPAMEVAAAHAIAEIIPEEELGREYVIPSVFNRDVAPSVATAVSAAAEADGVARLTR
jgi:malate dehydrogenase (oxaloacetate-decarboxylating)